MKKLFNYALIGAIALTGSTMLTSCSSSDDAAADNTNPNYNSEKNEVTTQFVLNVAANTGDDVTRQSAVTVQRDFSTTTGKNFRGMTDAKLVSLATGITGQMAPYSGGATTDNWSAASGLKVKIFNLGALYGANSVDNTGVDTENKNANNSSHRVIELTLPLTTDAMLVYGRALPNNDTEENGQTVYNVAPEGKVENTTFDLVSRLGDNSTVYSNTCKLVAVILNRIMLSQVNTRAKGSDAYAVNGYSQNQDLPALSWRGLAAVTGTMTALEEKLAKLYNAATGFTTSNTAIRAGSSSAVLSMVGDIYKTAQETYGATALDDNELNAQRLAYDIISRIGYYFDYDSTNKKITGFKILGTYSATDGYTEGSIYKALCDNAGYTNETIVSNFGGVTNDMITDLPSFFKLPDGVSQLFFTAYGANGDKGFSYNSPSQSLIDISNTLNPAKYMYPAELLYFDNSLLRVNNEEVEASSYPNGYNPWDAAGSWGTGWSVGQVTSTTRSVAVKNNINYGVAMLQTKVALQSEVTFKDNRQALVPTEENQELSASQVGGFTLTGILIGGQYKQLGWNYLAKTGASENVNYVIYDNKIAGSGSIPTGTGGENYTLVFDNYKSGGTTQDNVLVALEFQNGNEKDFYGKGGIIPKGSKFYLVGRLNMPTTPTITWPTYYAIPPYTSGATTETPRIFIQDYMTTATFTIGENSLKNAYSTVPDLRSSQTSLGLSVDLNWRQGLIFENVILGQ